MEMYKVMGTHKETSGAQKIVFKAMLEQDAEPSPLFRWPNENKYKKRGLKRNRPRRKLFGIQRRFSKYSVCQVLCQALQIRETMGGS